MKGGRKHTSKKYMVHPLNEKGREDSRRDSDFHSTAQEKRKQEGKKKKMGGKKRRVVS